MRILYGIQNTTNAILQILSKSKDEIDICSNHTVLSTAVGDEAFKKGLGDARSRGARLRYVTEITKQNIAYCKELMEIVELRHLDGLKANFILNKTEYVSIATTTTFQEGKIMPQTIHNNVQEILEQQQYFLG